MRNFVIMETLLQKSICAALAGGKVIREVYAKPFEVFYKDDASPVTRADLLASSIIKDLLADTQLPFVSEEDLPADRSEFHRYWLVDPLDGTQEFVNRNGEFTVNIALIDDRRPVMGVIYAPVSDKLWYAESDSVYFVNGASLCADVMAEAVLLGKSVSNRPYTVLVSRSHRTDEVDRYIDAFIRPLHPDLVVDTCGSSLKFARLAEGSADAYVCYSKTKEWDTAAADAILCAAGGCVLRISDDKPLEYDKDDYPNPPFVAWAMK